MVMYVHGLSVTFPTYIRGLGVESPRTHTPNPFTRAHTFQTLI